jgi:hypothetical protein
VGDQEIDLIAVKGVPAFRSLFVLSFGGEDRNDKIGGRRPDWARGMSLKMVFACSGGWIGLAIAHRPTERSALAMADDGGGSPDDGSLFHKASPDSQRFL